MNCYRVTLTVFNAESFVAEVEAMDKDHARRFGEESAERQYPDASEIRVDEVELLTAAPEPPTDPLAQARDIIGGLLEAAKHGAMDLSQTDEPAGARAGTAIEAARAFLATKEPTT
jgi:hypothetical protein